MIYFLPWKPFKLNGKRAFKRLQLLSNYNNAYYICYRVFTINDRWFHTLSRDRDSNRGMSFKGFDTAKLAMKALDNCIRRHNKWQGVKFLSTDEQVERYKLLL